ncbi:WD repeat-containing protein 82-like [Chironomus tepperi]|uniref:WD repeat-containing protein 82-like n=1 Tax=Chironomus tepperi TaxID=113505 RepID=UPI00391FACC1
MSSNNIEIASSTQNQPQMPHHPQNSVPTTPIQSPKSSTSSPVYRATPSTPQQPQHPAESSKISNYYHKHHEIDHKITADDLRNFRVAYTSEIPDESEIKSIDFCASGMAGLYNTQNTIRFIWLDPERPQDHVLHVAKYGCGQCRFLNPYDKVIHTSTKSNDDLRLYNICKNGYDIYFKGHTAEVTGLDVFPLWHRNFVSASKDNSVKFWDVRHQNCTKSISTKPYSIIACHPKELQVAVAYPSDKTSYIIEIYDLRTVDDDSPIIRLHFDGQESQWKLMKFSNNGKYLMINTNSSLTIIIDVDSGEMCRRLYGYNNKYRLPIETCFSPDSKFVLGGSQDGKVHIWNLETHDKDILDKPATGSTGKIIFNPVFMCFATAGEKYHLWIEKE